MDDKLKPLVEVTKLLKEQALESHRKNLAESARVESEISEIDRMRGVAQESAQGFGTQRMIGADTLWAGWLLRRRAQLLHEAAMCRARSLDSQTRAKDAFSRAEATQSLVEKAVEEKLAKRRALAAERLEALNILRPQKNPDG